MRMRARVAARAILIDFARMRNKRAAAARRYQGPAVREALQSSLRHLNRRSCQLLLLHWPANAIEHGINLRELSMTVHTHPTLCEVLDEAFKGGMGRSAH